MEIPALKLSFGEVNRQFHGRLLRFMAPTSASP